MNKIFKKFRRGGAVRITVAEAQPFDDGLEECAATLDAKLPAARSRLSPLHCLFVRTFPLHQVLHGIGRQLHAHVAQALHFHPRHGSDTRRSGGSRRRPLRPQRAGKKSRTTQAATSRTLPPKKSKTTWSIDRSDVPRLHCNFGSRVAAAWHGVHHGPTNNWM